MSEQVQMRSRARAMMAVAVCAAVVALAVLVLMPRVRDGGEQAGQTAGDAVLAASGDAALAQAKTALPTKLAYSQEVVGLTDVDGRPLPSSQLADGQVTVLLWADSTCPHCQDQMSAIGQAIASGQGDGVRYVLVGRLGKAADGGEETQEDFLAWARDQGFSGTILLDHDRATYDALGMGQVPTTLVLDGQGEVRLACAEAILTPSQLASMVAEVRDGGAAGPAAYVSQALSGPDALAHTSDAEAGGDATAPKGPDVLCESLGLQLEHAQLAGDGQALSRLAALVPAWCAVDGTPSWLRLADGSYADSDALVDDLRLARVLAAAGEDDLLDDLAQAIAGRSFAQGTPRSHHALSTGVASGDVALADLDLVGMRVVAPQAHDDALALVEGGYISDAFPFHYRTYSYEEGGYDREAQLNMSEALTVVAHLADDGHAPQATLDWLRRTLADGRLYTTYRADGTPTTTSESAATYALAGIVGCLSGDEQVSSLALWHLQSLRTYDQGGRLDGTLGVGEAERRSYDQLTAMVFYDLLERHD